MIKFPDNINEFRQIANIHKEELNNQGFLSKCSVKFLTIFYRWMSKDKESFVIIILEENKNEVLGFIFCVEKAKRYYKKFFYHNFIKILFLPKDIFNILKSFKKKRINLNIYKAELTQIAIKNSFQGKGFAKKLIQEAEKEFIKRGIKEYYLQVDKDNLKAINLYKNKGFKEITHQEENSFEKIIMNKRIVFEEINNMKKE